MAAPYQCLAAWSSQDAGGWTLFGASGPKLVAQASNGATTVWPEQQAQTEVSKRTRSLFHKELVYVLCSAR